MDDSDEEMEWDDSLDDASEEDDEHCFDSEPVRQASCGYEALDASACQQLAQQAVHNVSELLCCQPDVSALLLRHFRWDREKLMDGATPPRARLPPPSRPPALNAGSGTRADYMADPDRVLKLVGIVQGDDKSVLHSGDAVLVGGVERAGGAPLPEIKCLICYDATTQYSALSCGHAYCNDCYRTFLEHKIADEGHNAVFARCPEDKCPAVVSGRLVRSLLPPGERLRQYENASRLERSYVDDNPGLKWCPAVNCNRAIRAQKGQLGVRCPCGSRWCFTCQQDDHAPASCDELQRWQAKCRDDSETYNWLVSNTKACPKCFTAIEKNGGCNHMTCKKADCKYEFCWVCLGAWKDHAGSYYSCNKYDPDKDKDTAEGKKRDSSRAALERYLHYYTRYTNHNASLKFEVEAKAKMEAKIKEMEQLGDNTWMDCLYLNEANEALHECRYALQYTYVYAFYLPGEGNYRTHFEMQQMELERQTEGLAELLERAVEDINRMEVVHCFQMAKKRLRNLNELVETEEARAAVAGSSGQGSSSGQ